MTSQGSHMKRDSSLRNAWQCIQIYFKLKLQNWFYQLLWVSCELLMLYMLAHLHLNFLDKSNYLCLDKQVSICYVIDMSLKPDYIAKPSAFPDNNTKSMQCPMVRVDSRTWMTKHECRRMLQVMLNVLL